MTQTKHSLARSPFNLVTEGGVRLVLLYAIKATATRPQPSALCVKSQTSVAVVINEDDLLQQDGRRGLQDAVNGPQQGGPGLVIEGYDHRGGG